MWLSNNKVTPGAHSLHSCRLQQPWFISEQLHHSQQVFRLLTNNSLLILQTIYWPVPVIWHQWVMPERVGSGRKYTLSDPWGTALCLFFCSWCTCAITRQSLLNVVFAMPTQKLGGNFKECTQFRPLRWKRWSCSSLEVTHLTFSDNSRCFSISSNRFQGTRFL